MSYVDAVIFTTFKTESGTGDAVPSIVDEIFAWAKANGETLPGTTSPGSCVDLTGQPSPSPATPSPPA